MQAAFDEIKISPSRATAARICQEALTNIARHSKATFVRVLVKENGLIEIQDNGTGIPPEKLNDPGSLGLLGMKERSGDRRQAGHRRLAWERHHRDVTITVRRGVRILSQIVAGRAQVCESRRAIHKGRTCLRF